MKKIRALLLVAPLVLAGCGEGYEMVRTSSFPYNNERTAGTGVAYVLAKLAPAKELNLEPVVREQEPVAEEPTAIEETQEILEGIEPAVNMDEVFDEAMTK
jgi:hypothetical protein